MKRIFPVIIVLITLSLVSIIIVQVNWFKAMTTIRRDQLSAKAEQAVTEVALDLSKQASSAPYLRIPRKPSLSLGSDDMGFGLARPTISQHYTSFEINEKLKKAFDAKELKDVDFEFGITSNSNLYNVEVSSNNFAKEVQDETTSKRIIIPLTPDPGSNLEGLVPYEHLIVVIPNLRIQVWESMVWMIIGSVFFSLVILTAFWVTVQALIRQKKLSEIKTDFINNMTHEFKTPLATISLAVDALRNTKVLQNPEKMKYFSEIIKEENKRMNKHVETILQAGLMDKQDLKIELKNLHVHPVIEGVVDKYKLQIEEKNGAFEIHLDARSDKICADENHFTNMISNLVDNAIKYSRENLLIKICTCIHGKNLQIKVQDNGIGMSKETAKRVFEKFYRAHTGNIHNVKGFGLGMSYVKSVIDIHNGKIKVDSILGKGSTFIVEIPLADAEEHLVAESSSSMTGVSQLQQA